MNADLRSFADCITLILEKQLLNHGKQRGLIIQPLLFFVLLYLIPYLKTTFCHSFKFSKTNLCYFLLRSFSNNLFFKNHFKNLWSYLYINIRKQIDYLSLFLKIRTFFIVVFENGILFPFGFQKQFLFIIGFQIWNYFILIFSDFSDMEFFVLI